MLSSLLVFALLGCLWKIGTQHQRIKQLEKPSMTPEQLHTLSVALWGMAGANPTIPLYQELAMKYQGEAQACRTPK